MTYEIFFLLLKSDDIIPEAMPFSYQNIKTDIKNLSLFSEYILLFFFFGI